MGYRARMMWYTARTGREDKGKSLVPAGKISARCPREEGIVAIFEVQR